MISIIQEAPENIAAFVATNEVTKEDFERIVLPKVKSIVDRFGELNYLLKIDTELGNFTFGAWWEDALLGIRNITKWNRAAIVTDEDGIKKFTSIFSKLMPGEFRSFNKNELLEAISWAATD